MESGILAGSPETDFRPRGQPAARVLLQLVMPPKGTTLLRAMRSLLLPNEG